MKQRIAATILTVLLLATVCSVSYADGYGFMMSATSDYTEASKGESFTVTFYANDILSSEGILSISANVEYDPSHIQFEYAEFKFPTKWKKVFYASPEELDSTTNKKHIQCVLLCDDDGDLMSSGVNTDNTIGFTLRFNVVTSSVTSTSINILQDEYLSCTVPSGFSVESQPGLAESYTLNLNKVVSEPSSVESFDPFYSAAPDQSYDTAASYDIESSEEISSSVEISEVEDPSLDESETPSDISIDRSDESVSNEEKVSSEDEGESVVASDVIESSDDLSKDDGNGTFKWIFIIVAVVVVIIAAAAVGIYMVKNKKDDMNPVNPG